VGRYPDGNDTGSNCRDFHILTASGLAADSAAGANNIKVTSAAEFSVGQKITGSSTVFVGKGVLG
jgi:hypothetical protein